MEKTGAGARASPLLSLPFSTGVLDLRGGQLEPVTSPQPAVPSACVSQGWESGERRAESGGQERRTPPEEPDTEPAEQRLDPPH